MSVELLERDAPLAALGTWLGVAGSGAGRFVLLGGEAGVGKSCLVDEFCARHQHDARIWRGACDALSTPRPLGPLHDIALTAGGDLAVLMSGDTSRHERFSGFLQATASPLEPTIVVFEDVHWADEATRDLLLFVARRVADVNALVIATYRNDEVGGGHPLRRTLGSMATLPAVERWALSPLSRAAVATLAGPQETDVDRLYQVTGGNPFFVTEVVASGQGQVPTTVSDAVLARVQALPNEPRKVLQAAAVVPDDVEVTLLSAVGGQDADAVQACLDAGLLRPVGTHAVRFRHELARLAVEAAIPLATRPRLHAAVLEELRRLDNVDPARLAYHAEAANDPDAILAYAPTAARQASALGAHREAVDHLTRSASHADRLDTRDRAELFEHLGDECTAIDREAAAIDAYDRAIAAWKETGDREREATALARRAYALWGLGRSHDARRSVNEAIELLKDGPAGTALATAYTYSAHLDMLAREIPDAIELGQRAVAIAEETGDTALLARALNIVGAAQWFVDPPKAERTLARALETARASGDDEIVGIVLRMLGSGGGEVRRYAGADRWLREGVQWCAEHDLDIHGDYCLAWAARSAFEQGRWSEAEDLTEQVIRRGSEHAPTRIVALTAQGRVRVRRGDSDADAPLRSAWELATTTGDLQRLWPAAAGRAERAWLTGVDPDGIADLVADTFELAVRLGQGWAIGELGFWLWRADVLDQPPPGAAEPFARQIAGDWRGAAAAWEELGCPYDVAVALADGDDPQELTRAFSILGRLGAAPMADRVAARLRELGVHDLPRRPSRATVDNPGGLTSRQLEVLGLLVDGLTNREIASSLYISPKTAGHHVSAILETLGAADRGEAAAIARERGLVAG